jgi:hypothetical protein
MTTGQAVGVNVGIFNPALDADGSIARGLGLVLGHGSAENLSSFRCAREEVCGITAIEANLKLHRAYAVRA